MEEQNEMSNISKNVSIQTNRTSLSDRKIKVFKNKEDKVKEVKPPTLLQNIFHTKYLPNTQHFFSDAKSVNAGNMRNVLEETTPYKYPNDTEQFSFKVVQKVWADKLNRKEQALKYYEKTNLLIRQKQDLLKRLFVEDPGAIVSQKTLLDMDPDFYTIIEGRPIDKRFSMSKYLQNLRDILRNKLGAGYISDEILMIEEKVREEESVINEIKEMYKLYLDGFETFLSNNYDEAMKELRHAETQAMKTADKNEEIKYLYTKLASLEYSVHKLEDRWRDLKMYQKFLYYVSPMSWRRKYDYINNWSMSQATEPRTVFKKYRLTSRGQIPTLETLVDAYLDEIQKEEKPLLYFQSPKELKQVFRFIEIQNLNCLLHTEDMAVPMENMKDSMKNARKKFESEEKALQDIIDGLSRDISWEEECVESLKSKAMKLINGQFRSLVSDDEVLKLHVYVEDVYEACVAPNDSNFSIFEMMKAVEQYYNDLVLTLDRFPQHVVKISEKRRFNEEIKLAKLCKEAAAKITLVDRITSRLKKSLEPPFSRTTRPLVWRSTPPTKPPKPPKGGRQPTDMEKEYLSYFTDYCEFQDHVIDYGIDFTVDETNWDAFSTMAVFKPKEPEFQF